MRMQNTNCGRICVVDLKSLYRTRDFLIKKISTTKHYKTELTVLRNFGLQGSQYRNNKIYKTKLHTYLTVLANAQALVFRPKSVNAKVKTLI